MVVRADCSGVDNKLEFASLEVVNDDDILSEGVEAIRITSERHVTYFVETSASSEIRTWLPAPSIKVRSSRGCTDPLEPHGTTVDVLADGTPRAAVSIDSAAQAQNGQARLR